MTVLSKRKIRSWITAVFFAAVFLYGVPAIERATAPIPQAARGQMGLYVLDVGQGDAILAQEGNMQILIDGGPGGAVLERLGEIMPPDDRTIELVVLTHPHSDHVAGLNAVLGRYTVGRILKTDVTAASAVDRAFEREILKLGIPVDDPKAVSQEKVGGMSFDVLHYEDASDLAKKHKGSDDGLNDSSIVGMLSFGARKFLLMGDATQAVEDSLRRERGDGLMADFIKIGHHGSAYSTSSDFLASVAPAYAAVSLGAKNSYGFPAWRVLRLLEQSSVVVYRTDTDGTVAAVTDGEALQVGAEKVR
jgi:competence protein ComEC